MIPSRGCEHFLGFLFLIGRPDAFHGQYRRHEPLGIPERNLAADIELVRKFGSDIEAVGYRPQHAIRQARRLDNRIVHLLGHKPGQRRKTAGQ